MLGRRFLTALLVFAMGYLRNRMRSLRTRQAAADVYSSLRRDHFMVVLRKKIRRTAESDLLFRNPCLSRMRSHWMQRTRWRGLGCQLIDRNNPDSDLDGRSRSVLLRWRSSTLVADLVSIKYKLVSSVPVSSLPTDVINVFSAKRNMPSSPMLPWSNPIYQQESTRSRSGVREDLGI